MCIVLGVGLIGKAGVAILISIVQTIIVVSLGIFGAHGILSFITYILPGLIVDIYIIDKTKRI